MDFSGVNFNDPNLYKNVDWSKVDYGKQAAPAAAPATAAAAPAALAPATPVTSATSSLTAATPGASGISNTQMQSALSQVLPASTGQGTSAGGFSTAGFGGRTAAVVTSDTNAYKGNVGSPYGSNMQVLPAGTNPADYKYTNTFSNTTNQDETVYVWNKYGKDGQPFTGQSDLANALAVKIPAHSQATVAFDENSQVAWAKDTGQRNGDGSIKGTWGEGDFGDTKNQYNGGAASGYDVNTAPGNNGYMQISSGGAAPDQSTTGLHWSDTTQADNMIVPGAVRLSTTLGD